MCRNITELRGLEPPATREEIEAAARQFVRKVTGISRPGIELAAMVDAAAVEIADITERLLAAVPQRRQPPKTVPPLRRPEVRARLDSSRSQPVGPGRRAQTLAATVTEAHTASGTQRLG